MATAHEPLDAKRPQLHSHAERGNEMGATAPVTTPGARQKGAEVNVSKAKGRPMLTWVGKQPLGRVSAYPAQWIERHNRQHPINRIHVIELRTDRKAGGIIRHEPMSARVGIRREGENLVVEIADVLSPSILQRLNLQEGLFRAEVTDWRAVVDCVLIDTDYRGGVFTVTLADVPERKQDLVQGRYRLLAPPPGSRVAVKIIDRLGEELLIEQVP